MIYDDTMLTFIRSQVVKISGQLNLYPVEIEIVPFDGLRNQAESTGRSGRVKKTFGITFILDYLYKEKVTFMEAVKLCASRGDRVFSYSLVC